MSYEYEELECGRAKAKGWDKVEVLMEDQDYVAERKEDGWRFLMHDGSLPRMYLTGRNYSKKTGRLSEKGQCAPMLRSPYLQTLDYTVLDGEIMAPPESGLKRKDIAGIMNVEPVEAAKRVAEVGAPVYHIFDVLFFNGQDYRNEAQCDRRGLLENILPKLDNPLLSLVLSTREDKMKFFDDEVAAGGEGIILKNRYGTYGQDWIKVKRLHTLDVVITGFTEAREGKTGKFKGLIGAVKVSVWRDKKLVEVGQVSGMRDDIRVWMTQNQESLIGQCMEIKAQEWAKDRLFHPRYKQMRPDCDPKSCTWDKMQADLNANIKLNADDGEQLKLF